MKVLNWVKMIVTPRLWPITRSGDLSFLDEQEESGENPLSNAERWLHLLSCPDPSSRSCCCVRARSIRSCHCIRAHSSKIVIAFEPTLASVEAIIASQLNPIEAIITSEPAPTKVIVIPFEVVSIEEAIMPSNVVFIIADPKGKIGELNL